MTLRNKARRSSVLVALLCVALTLVLAYMWQRIFFNMCIGGIFSDVPLHIELALGHNDYGLSSLLIRALYALFDEHRAQTCLSLCMAANNVLGIATLWLLLRRLFPELDGWLAMLASILALLCGPWLIPGYQTEIYLGAHNGNLYHNMTVLFSRTFIPLCFIFFFRCWDARRGRIKWRDWLPLTLCFLICTLFKPNFAFAFIPMLAGLLLYELIKRRGEGFKNLVVLGCAVVPAGLACIWQYTVLYDGSFAGASSGLAFRFLWGAELLALLAVYLRGLLLPVYTLSLQGGKEESRGHITLILLTEAVALLENAVLMETGYRENHGNFDWGGLALYPTVFALSIALLLRMIGKADLKKPRDAVKCLVGAVLLLGHLAVGIYYLYYVSSSGDYYAYMI